MRLPWKTLTLLLLAIGAPLANGRLETDPSRSDRKPLLPTPATFTAPKTSNSNPKPERGGQPRLPLQPILQRKLAAVAAPAATFWLHPRIGRFHQAAGPTRFADAVQLVVRRLTKTRCRQLLDDVGPRAAGGGSLYWELAWAGQQAAKTAWTASIALGAPAL